MITKILNGGILKKTTNDIVRQAITIDEIDNFKGEALAKMPNPIQTFDLPVFDPDKSNFKSSFIPRIAKANSGMLTLLGKWQFKNRTNQYAPARHLLVQIINSTTNEVLASSYTDANGDYSCGPFLNPGVPLKSVLSTYVDAAGNILTVIDPDLVVPPGQTTPVSIDHAHKSASPAHTFGNIGTGYIGSNLVPYGEENDHLNRAFWLMDDLIKTWLFVWSNTGDQPGGAIVEWNNSLQLPNDQYWSGFHIQIRGASPMSDSILLHEYAHNIMWNIYHRMPSSSNCNPHNPLYLSDYQCAWKEGWANFMALAVKNDCSFVLPHPTNSNTTGGWINFENTSSCDEGPQVEGRVTGFLWDVLDSANDNLDDYDGVFSDIWNAFSYRYTDDIIEFAENWINLGYSVEAYNCWTNNTLDAPQ